MSGIRVQIGTDERPLNEVTESWVNQQIRDRRNGGAPICVKVHIHTSSLNLVLSTPACAQLGGGGGGGRAPTPHEREFFTLWERRGLNDPSFTGGNLVAFLKQVQRMV